ncbi:surfactin synthase thioesterase subunit [Undibacterium sp. GrIS 1.2]
MFKKRDNMQTSFTSFSDAAPTARLICLPHAGGSPRYFAPWRRNLPPDIDLVVAQYPSREVNVGANDDPAKVATRLADAMSELPNLPYVLFGHSLGGLLGFELTRVLQSRGLPLPRKLCISACKAPIHLPSPFVRHALTLPEGDFVQFVGTLGGLSPDVLENTEFCDMIRGAMRRDFDLLARYRYRPGPPLAVSMMLLCGDRDGHITREHLLDWRPEALIEPEIHMLTGDHFYLEDTTHQAWILDQILTALRPKYETTFI